MAYLSSTYIQQKGISKRVLKQKASSKVPETTTSKKNSKNETAKYALGDQKSLTASVRSSKQIHSPIYVHETRHIHTKIPGTSSDTQNKRNNGLFENETSNIFHDCGNHNHQCMMQSTLLPTAYTTESLLKDKLQKSNFPTDDKRQNSKENLIQVKETYWPNWKPSKISIQKNKSSCRKTSKKGKTKSVEYSKVTTLSPQGSTIRQKNTQKTASLFRYSKNKYGKESHVLPPRFNDQELKVFPTLSVKTNLTYYSQEFETNRVDYDESLLLARRKKGDSTSSSISTKTGNVNIGNKDNGPTSLQKEDVESCKVLTIRSQPTETCTITKSQLVVTPSDNSSFISKTDINLIPIDSRTKIENSIADLISSKNIEKSATHSLPSTNSKRILKEQTVEPHYAVESDNEEITKLKHTDSLILACKKRSRERPYLQQPKAIRLFKRSVSTKTTKVKNSLNPILKKDTSLDDKPTLIRLGKTGNKFSRKSK